MSSKHSLALVNRGQGTTRELLELAREIRRGVKSRFGVELTPEPVFLGCALAQGAAETRADQSVCR